MSMTFGYWNIRGLGSASRLLLKYVRADYEEIIYDIEGADFERWFKIKSTLGFDFPNLPYLIDGDLKLTQCHAILKYLGRKYGLTAGTDPEQAREEMVLLQINDLANRLVQTAYQKVYNTDEQFQTEMKLLRADLDSYLELEENYLHEGQQWVTGDKLTYVDFLNYEIIDRHRELVDKACLDKYPKLSAIIDRFEQLQPLKAFLNSDEYRKGLIFTPAAKIGGTRR